MEANLFTEKHNREQPRLSDSLMLDGVLKVLLRYRLASA